MLGLIHGLLLLTPSGTHDIVPAQYLAQCCLFQIWVVPN